MKLSTFGITFGPAILMVTTKFALAPNWINEWSFPDLLLLGAVIGVFGSAVTDLLEPLD